MTEGVRSAPFTGPNHCRTALRVSILAVLLLTLNADSEDSECDTEIKVRRSTVSRASRGDDVTINCTVVFCDASPPTVLWQKVEKTPVSVNTSSHVGAEWKRLSRSEGVSLLTFRGILSSDAGLYRCQSGSSVGHSINVSVDDKVERNNVTWTNDIMKNSTTPQSKEMWRYVSTAAGIVSFVVMVIVTSVASMRGCKGKSKKETPTDNQHMAIPMVKQPPPRAGLQPSPAAPPPRRSTRRKAQPRQPSLSPPPRGNGQLYGKTERRREAQRNSVEVEVEEEEEAASVVYAALNHQLPARAAARPQRPREETSEYATIHVQDPTPTPAGR